MLNEMFPEVDLGHLRQCLLDAPHSYLYTSLATLLSDSTLSPDAISQWHASDNSHRSRRTSTQRKHEPLPKRQNPGEITYADLIKDEIYADGTLQLLCAQFPNIWKSSIKAIMVRRGLLVRCVLSTADLSLQCSQAEHNNDYFASVEAVKRIQEERPINFFARTWAAFTQAFSNKPTPPNSVTKEDFSIASYLSTLQNPGSMSPMLLYELQLHLSATQPQSRPSTSPRKSGGPVSQHLKYQDIECGCCFSDISVEQATTCAEGCLFCKECLARTVQESVYGQASLRLYREPNDEVASNSLGIDVGGEGTGIRCLSIEGCQASFSDKELQRCISSELYKALEDRLIQQNLQILQVSVKLNTKKKGARKGESVRIVQCPFCAYVEVEDVPTVSYLWKETSSPLEILRSFASIVTIGMIYLSWTLSAVFVPELLNTSSQRNRPIVSQPSSSTQDRHDSIHLAIQPIDGFQAIQDRVQQIFDTCLTKSSGTVFRCRNMSKATQHNSSSTFASPAVLYSMLPPPPLSSSSAPKPFLTGSSHTCGRASCRLCLKLYYPGHECVDSTAGLRLLKEQAASNAIKRQCPECGLSFVKDNGCNKIVCRCGYVMCFVCRKGIAEERYAHFCQHVRDPRKSLSLID